MTIIFYDANLKERTSPQIAPLSVIITDSSDTIPECQLVLSDEYNNIIMLNGYFAIVGRQQVYQITDITAAYSATTQYTVTGKEVTALVFSRRIAQDDYMDATESKYVEEWIEGLFFGGEPEIYPAFWDRSGNVFAAVEKPSIMHYKTSAIWDKGESLFDYVLDERDYHKCAVKFASSIDRTNVTPLLIMSVSLHPANTTPPIFLPSDKIEEVSITHKPAEVTELDYDVSLQPYGTDDEVVYNGRITPDVAYDTPYMTAHTSYLTPLVNVTQDAGTPTSPADMSFNAVLKRAFGTTSASTYSYGGRTYIYTLTTGTTNTQTLYCYSREAAQNIVDWYKANPVNGHYTDETITAAYSANKIYDGDKYSYRVTLTLNSSSATTSGWICIANTPGTVDPLKDCRYLYPITLAAIESKLVKNLPPVTSKTIDVTFADAAKATLGDKLIIHAGTTIVSGIVSSVTTTYEGGTEMVDIEVKEWTEG